MKEILDPYFQITDVEIPVSGLASPVEILHVSDLHISHAEPDSTREQAEKVQRQKQAWEPVRRHFANLYGDSVDDVHMLDPEDGWKHTVDMINETRPDAVLFTGDMMEDYSRENLSFLSDGLSRLEVPWMWVVGNHERGHDAEYGGLTGGDPSFQTLSVKGLRFIGINNADKQVTDGQMENIRKAAGEMPSVLVMHIPMMTPFNKSSVSRFGEYFLMGTGDVLPSTQAFLSYMQEDNNPIAAVLCGHVHGRHVSEYRPGRLQVCASSCMVGAINRIRFLPQ